MGIKTFIARKWAARRARTIQREARDPGASQERTLRALLQKASRTEFGREHGFSSIQSPVQFRQQVPVRDYEAARPFFEKIIRAGNDITWPGRPLYLAKTSGTTSGSKFIPITAESIRYQVKGARDALLMHIHRSRKAGFLKGKMLFLSGSPVLDTNEWGMKTGRLSGIVNHYVPGYLKGNQIPSFSVNSIEDWEEKVSRILDEAIGQDLRLISGIPPWVQMFFERLEARTGKLPLQQWPNLGLFVQGGVDFSPYRAIFDRYFQSKVEVVEVFPASEGFFAFQDADAGQGLRLNLDYGIYFEFIPSEEYGSAQATRLGIGEVELNRNYAMVVSTNAGLWAYDVGDMVQFVSLDPPRLKVTGRVKQFISAFGEHVIEAEVNRAMISACAKSGAEVNEFTVAPLVSEIRGQSCHQWWVEFEKPPADEDAFAALIDQAMREQNVYYNDLREGGMLRRAEMVTLKARAAREYMKSIGKLGGQNKFPRLKNNRDIVEGLSRWRIDQNE